MKVVRGDEARQEQIGAFTGETQLQRLLGAQQPGGMAVSLVHFEDGSRTHWHVHPGEQVLYVVEGEGRVGTADEEMRIGPATWSMPLPWSATGTARRAGHSMTHLSVTNVGPAEWFEAPE